MLRAITLILLLFGSDNSLHAQVGYADSLLAFEWRVFQAPEEQRDAVLCQKLAFQIKSDSTYEHALQTARRIHYKNLDSTTAVRFLWNASLISYLNQVTEEGLVHWKRYLKLTEDSTIQSQLLGFLLSYKNDSVVQASLSQSLNGKDSLFVAWNDQLQEPTAVKAVALKKIASILIPGSGLMINGNVAKGALSLGINTAAAVFMHYLYMHKAWLNLIFWGTNLGGKFYFGGLRLLDKEIDQKQLDKTKKRTQKSALLLEKIVEKYPLNFH